MFVFLIFCLNTTAIVIEPVMAVKKRISKAAHIMKGNVWEKYTPKCKC